MIHFDFIVPDEDAENIMRIMQAAVSVQDEHILNCIVDGDQSSLRWHQEHKQYILGLMHRMTNKRVDQRVVSLL